MNKKLKLAAKKYRLTERETEIAAQLSAAKNIRQIAAHFDISTHTVDFHVRGIYRKFSAHCLADFFLLAYLR